MANSLGALEQLYSWQRRRAFAWPAEQVALEQIAAEVHDRLPFFHYFHALGDDRFAHVVAKLNHRAHDLALHVVFMDAANERHVELDEFRFQLREAGQPRIAGAEVIERDPEAQRTQARNAIAHIADVFERSALGNLEHDAVSEGSEGRIFFEQSFVDQIFRV